MNPFSAVPLTHPGRQRDHNEDAFWVPLPEQPGPEAIAAMGALYVVADGMGGHLAGEVAAQMAVDLIPRHYYADPDPDRSAALCRAIQAANARIHQAARAHTAQTKMGTTVVAVVIKGNQLIVAHAGDSRAYLLRQKRIRRLTEDHTWVNEQSRAGLLTPEEAANHPMRNIVTRSLGDKPDIEPTIAVGVVRPGDAILLCTDGLWDVVAEPEIARILSTQPLRQAVQSLVQAANAAGGPDNITAVVIPVGEAPRSPRVPWTVVGVVAGLIALALVCLLSAFLCSRLPPVASLLATATPSPTPTPPPPDTSIDWEQLGLSMDYRGSDRVADLARMFGYAQLIERLGHEQVIMHGLIGGEPLSTNGALCLQPALPYGVILVGQVQGVTESISTTFALHTRDVTYTVVMPRPVTLPAPLNDQPLEEGLLARFLGLAGETDTLYALYVQGRARGNENWQTLESFIPGAEWTGWFYARADSPAIQGLDMRFADVSCEEGDVVVVYARLGRSDDLDLQIVEGPFCLRRVQCQ